MNNILDFLGRALARYLNQPSPGYAPLTASNPEGLRRALRAGDVLLVEGNRRISVAIKYLTQSTWSHAALYIGDALSGGFATPDPPVLIEADLLEGVRAVPLSRYEQFHTRICRPVGLSAEHRDAVVRAAIARLGQVYASSRQSITDSITKIFTGTELSHPSAHQSQQSADYQRSTDGPITAPTAAGTDIPSTYQMPRKGAAISVQCRE